MRMEIRAEAERQILAAIATVRSEYPDAIPPNAEVMVKTTLRVK